MRTLKWLATALSVATLTLGLAVTAGADDHGENICGVEVIDPQVQNCVKNENGVWVAMSKPPAGIEVCRNGWATYRHPYRGTYVYPCYSGTDSLYRPLYRTVN